MYFISRLHLSNYGFQDAWFDAFTLDFTDAQSSRPTDVILQAPNGTGKTSLLGALFSLFDPAVHHFLPHMANEARHFHQYFDTHGLPGLIALELYADAGHGPVKRVLGQIAVLRNGDSRDVTRQFFSFHEKEGVLSFDDLPGVRDSAQKWTNYEQAQSWLRDATARYPEDFYITDVQSNWAQHLGIQGVDVNLFRKMTEFSRIEGGIDKSFLNFKSQDAFLREFFGLTLSEERTAAVLATVDKATLDMRDKPKQERGLASLQKVEAAFGRFTVRAAERETHQQALTGAQHKLNSLTAALLEVFSMRSARFDTLKASLDEAREAREASRLAQAEAESMAEATQARVHLWVEEEARGVRDTAQQHLTAVRREQRAINASRYAVTARARKTELKRLEEEMAAASAGLAPFQASAEAAGTRYKAALHRDQENADAAVKRHQGERAAFQGELTQLATADKEAAQVCRQLDQSEGRLSALLSEVQRHAEQLTRDGVLASVDEEPGLATERLDEEAARLEGAAEYASAELDAHQRQIEALAEASALAHAHFVQRQAERKPLLEQLNRVTQRISTLRALPALSRFGNPAELDLFSAALLQETQNTEKLHRIQQVSALDSVSQMQKDIQFIEHTGLAAPSADTLRVVEYLTESGIRSAKPHLAYLASVEPDVTRARALYAADPARYAGVAIIDATELSAAKQLSFEHLELSAPVVVSRATNVAAQAYPEETLVLPATNAAAYNKGAAALQRDALEHKMATEQAGAQRHGEMLAELEVLSAGLRELPLLFSHESFEQLQHACAAAEAALEEAECAHQNAASALYQAKGALRGKQVARDQALKHLEVQYARMKRLAQFAQDQARVQSAKTELIEVREKRVALDEATGKRQAQRAEVEARDGQLDTEIRNNWSLIADCQRWTGEIRYFGLLSPDIRAEVRASGVSAKDARFEYERAAQLFDTTQSERVGVLKATLAGVQAQFAQATAEYDEAVVGLSNSEVTPFIGLDYKTERARIDAALDVAEKAAQDAEQGLTRAQTTRELHQRGRAYPLRANTESFETMASLQVALERFEVEALEERERGDTLDATIGSHLRESAVLEKELAELRRHKKRLSTTDAEWPVADPALVALGMDLIDNIEAAEAERKAQDKAFTAADRKALESYQQFTATLSDPELNQHLSAALVQALLTNEFDAACQSADELAFTLSERRKTLEIEIARVQGDFDSTIDELELLANEAMGVLKTAVSKKVPSSVPAYADKPMLKMGYDPTTTAPDVRRANLAYYLNRLIESRALPRSGGDLAAEAVMAAAGPAVSHLNIRILKASQHMSVDYCPVHAIPSSGGEKAVAAVMLWAIVARIKRDNALGKMNGTVGPLIVDNLFAQVTFEPLLRLLRTMSNALGLQCLFTNLYEDRNIAAAFDRVLYLRTSKVRRTSGRKYVELAHSQIFPESGSHAVAAAHREQVVEEGA